MMARMSGDELRAYVLERFQTIKSANKFRYASYFKKYRQGNRKLPDIDDLERLMHYERFQEPSLTERERADSKNWLLTHSPNLLNKEDPE